MVIFFCLLLLLPLSAVSLSDASETITQEIYDFARGSYDILLRPADSRTEVEESLGLVEENYLGLGDGGISIAEWQTVLAREDIEVAAPVASIGLFTASEITYQLPERMESLRYENTVTTTDGVDEYVMSDHEYAYSFFPVEGTFAGYALFLEDSLVNTFQGEFPSFPLPPSYHQVVAVDTAQEAALTAIDFQALEGGGSGIGPEEFTSVPILSLLDQTIPLTASISIDQLRINEAELRRLLAPFNTTDLAQLGSLSYRDLDLHAQVEQELATIEVEGSEHYELDFSELISPFYDNFLFTDEAYRLHTYEDRDDFDFDLFGGISYHSQESSYYLSPVEYQIEGDNVTVHQVTTDEQTGVPIYRSLEKIDHFMSNDVGEVIAGEGIYFHHAGDFKLWEDREALAASPLGIYSLQETHLKNDEEKQVYPTAVPGSFISTPAHGIISLEWAERLKGDAPIDAIRVKVAGIDGYDEASAAKIKDIARQFSELGFTVDIVAGASHQWLDIEVEGLGTVMQPWTTLEAADTIVESWDLVKIVLVLLFSFTSFVYILFSFINLMNERRQSEAKLRLFGWSDKHIKKLRYMEWARLVGYPLVVAFPVAVGYAYYADSMMIVFAQVLVFVLICTLVLVSFTFSKQTNKTKKVQQSHGSITLQNTWYHHKRIIAAAIQLFLLTFISIFLTFLLQQEEQRTVQTNLGIYIHGQMEVFYYLLIAFLYLLSFLTIAEALVSLWRERGEEMTLFYHVGWGRSKLYMFYLREVCVWSTVAIFSGAGMSVIAYRVLMESMLTEWLTVAVIMIILFLMVVIVSAFVLSYIMKQFTNYRDRKVTS